MKKFLLFILVVIVVIIGIAVVGAEKHYKIPDNTATSTVATSTSDSAIANTFSYACADGKSMQASFSDSTMSLTLSDGREMSLNQAASGSGIRYTAATGTLIFQSEGNNAFVTEGSSTTYDRCLAASIVSVGKDSKAFTDQSKTFSFTYSAGFELSGGELGYTQSWSAEATTSGQQLVIVTIPKAFEPNTNFSEAKFTVGASADPQAVSTCTTNSFGAMGSSSQTIINGVPFTKITFGDAGAGNYYDTTSYRTVRNNQCYAIEYTIHSTNIDNYPKNAGITQFDKATVQNALESIVQSFKFL